MHSWIIANGNSSKKELLHFNIKNSLIFTHFYILTKFDTFRKIDNFFLNFMIANRSIYLIMYLRFLKKID